jgi:hypothetical protein
MATLEQLRSLFPNAGSDSDVIKSAAKEFGINPAAIAAEIGFDINKPGFMSDVKRGTGQVIGAFGSTAQDLGLPRVGKAVEGYGEDIQFRNPSQINTVGEAIRSPLTTIRETLGEVVPQIGSSTAFGLGGRALGGLIGSAAGPGGTLLGQSIGAAGGAYVGNLIQEYGGIRAEQREQGIDDKGRALGTGAAAAALDTAFGTERVVNKFLTKGSDILAREAGTSLLKNVAKQGAIGLGTEALTETGQTALERYGAYKPLTGDEAYNEYGLAAIKGGIGGGVIRGGLASISGERAPEGGNDIQQAFSQPNVSGTPTSNITPPPPAPPANNPDPMARLAELEAVGKGSPARTIEGPDGQPLKIPATEGRFFTPEEQQEYKALKAQVATMTPPAVVGGTTDIAQQTQAAAAENQQVDQAQQNLVKREDVFGKVASQYDPANPTSLNIFGQNIEGPRVAPFGDRFAAVFNQLQPHVQQIAQAIVQANKAFATPEKPSPLVSFSFNANNPVGSAGKAIEALGKVMTKFQIDHVQSLDEAVQILNKLSTTTKGNQLEQLNAVYEALTGQDTDGFTAAQTAKAEKGAKNGTLQATTGLGAVPVEGGAGQANDGNNGNVQPSNVQSVGTGSLPAGSLGLQIGQPSGEGIRTGTNADTGGVSDVGGSNASSQVTGATNEQASQGALGGGQAPGQSQQAGQPLVDQQSVQNGPRQYDPRIGFYSTDLSHISSERRVELISDLLLRVLAPLQNRKNTVPAEKRAEILRLALLEQFRHADIAEYTGLKVDTVEKQLERMGVKLVDGEFQVIDPEFAVRIVETATAYRSPEFPDGIGQGELSGLYNTRYEGEEQSSASLAEELEAGEQEGKPGAKLQEELGGKENKEGQTMGTVATAGGSQGAVDSEGAAALAKIEKLQAAVDKNPTDKKAVTALANAWTAYAKSQQVRAAKGEKAVKQESEEETDLTGKSTVEEAPKEEAINEVEVAKRKKVVDEARAKAAADRKGLEVGDTVINPKLGTGKVLSFAGNGDDTRVTVEFQSGQTKELLVKSAKLEKTNAVQKPSTTEVSVRKGAGGGKAVGQGNAQGDKAAGKAEVKQEAKPEEIKTPTEQWAVVSTLAPELPPYDVLTNSEKSRWDDLVRRGQANLAAAVKIIGESTQPTSTALAVQKPQTASANGTTQAVTNEANVIDVEARVIDETVGPQVAALPAPQVDRLEKHYGVKRDSAEFLTKVKEDVVKYATKGAEAVSAAIRDIIKAIHTGVLAAAMIFNPTAVSKIESFIVIPQETQTTQQQVLATVPAEASMMSDAGKQAYERLIPALKGKIGNKFITIADKPSGRIFVFKSDGSFVLQKKSLFGFAQGDLYKGNNDLPQNRITPAGLFGIHIVDAAKGGAAAKTAGEYDFGKVFALDDPDATVTFMHSVWLKETDAAKRAAALKNESAADSRYSFGCINVDKETYRELITKYGDNMDGSKLFVVPDVQSTVNDFITGNVADDRLVREGVQPVMKTVSTPVRSATQMAGADRTVAAKEEDIPAPKPTLFSKTSNTPAVKNTVGAIWNTLSKVFDVSPADSFYKDFIRVSQTADQAFRAAGKKIPLAQLQNAQAFIDPTDDRVVHLIADNIVKGSEFAVLLHEVGVHVGLKKKLGANFKILEGQVKAWANSPKDSLEYQVYERAMARVAAGRLEGSITADIAAEELVAYAAEEAALAGVKVKDAPRSKLEIWVKQLHDLASKAFKAFFGTNKVPELSVQDLVNFSFAAAQEQMQAYRNEVGATMEATDSQIAKYYAGPKGTYEGTRVEENESNPGPGEESFYWNVNDKFGSFTGIGTRAFYSPASPRGVGPRGVGAPAYVAMVVTSAESRSFGDMQGNNQDKVLLTLQATLDPQYNTWSLIVSGPENDGALYNDLYVEGLASTTRDNEGNEWTRLEGIPASANMRILAEFRRRLTRMKNGEIPNIDFVRVTGSGATLKDGNYKNYEADELAARFSKAPTVDSVINRMPKPLQKSTRGIVTNLLHQAKRGLYASAITEDLANMAKKYMPSVSKYLQAQYARQATRLNFEKRIENILAAYDKLPQNLKGDGKGSVNEFIHDSTREKKWGYYPGEQQIGTKLFQVDEDFKKRFDAFPAAAQQVIKDVFRHGHDALTLKQQAAENAVNREFEARTKAAANDADLLQQIAKEKKQMLKRITSIRNVSVGDPYAYLGRYGDYVVVAKSKEFIAYEEAAKGTQARVGADSITGDPQQAKNWLQENVANPLHYVVQFAETQAEADEIADQLQATGQYDIQPEDAGIKEANASYVGGSDIHLAVARLRNMASRSESTDDKLDKAIADLYLMTVADASARASELQRKNVAGADKNMMRNLATSGRADAHFLATMEHSDEINDSLEAMRNEARNDRREAMPMYNELFVRHANSMNYQPVGDLATAMTRMTTLWTLSTNPAFYLQQVLQTSVLSLPFMAGRLGYFRSARAIKRAYGDMSELVKGLGVNEHINFDKAPADVRNMLNTLVGMGKIDLGIDAEAKARTDEDGVLGKVMLKLQGVNTRIESINRATAAIAAYRGYLDRYKNGDTAAATKYAAEVVSNTHGSYDGFNTPRILSSDIGRVALQFKRFQIIQLSMLAKLIHTSFKGASADEKAVARASLKFIVAHMAVLGGALGVPFVSQAAWILSKVFGDEDEPDDYEYKLRRMIGDGPAADLLLRGVPAALGLESLGKKLSMENVASPFGPFIDPDLTSRAGAEKMLVGLMGPAANIGLKFTDALGLMTKGDYYKGLELALPNGVANVMKAYRFSNEGITMRNGDLVMKPEDISLIDAAFQAVGLPTTTITDRQYTQKVVAEFDKFYAERSKEIKASYVEGSRASDSASMAEAREDWQKLQESRVRNGYKRQSMSELFRAPVEARKRERGVVGGVETTKSNRRFVEQVSSVS